jgi:hypothetical protein
VSAFRREADSEQTRSDPQLIVVLILPEPVHFFFVGVAVRASAEDTVRPALLRSLNRDEPAGSQKWVGEEKEDQPRDLPERPSK